MSTLTLVTAFFDIGRGAWDGAHSRGLYQYLANGLRTMSLDDPMVIFIESKHEAFVRNARLGKEDKTRIIVRELHELKYYPLKDEIQAIMSSAEYKNGVVDLDPPQTRRPLYNIVMFSKLDLVNEVVRDNPFDSERFMWIDFGIHWNMLRTSMLNQSIRKTLSHIPAKLKYLSLSMPDQKDRDIHVFYKVQKVRVAGTAWSGDAAHLQRLLILQDEEVKRAMDNNLIDYDQSIFAQCYLREPDLFDLHFGWWDQLLTNWDGPAENQEYVQRHHAELLREGRLEDAALVQRWLDRSS